MSIRAILAAECESLKHLNLEWSDLIADWFQTRPHHSVVLNSLVWVARVRTMGFLHFLKLNMSQETGSSQFALREIVIAHQINRN